MTPPYAVLWESPDRRKTLWSLHNIAPDALWNVRRLAGEGYDMDRVLVCGPWGVMPASAAIPKLEQE